MSSKRVTLSLDEDLVSLLTKTSRRMGISRSALANMVLLESVTLLASMYEHLPPVPDDEDIKRFRGQSIELITEQYLKGMKAFASGNLFEDD